MVRRFRSLVLYKRVFRFMEPNVIILASGILPFGSIFIEM